MSYSYNYPRPMVTTDIVLLNKRGAELKILLIKRLNDPFKDSWALPGGFVDKDEALLNAAKRELQEETSITNTRLMQFKTYGDAGRDPRGHTVSVVYYAINTEELLAAKAGDDAKEIKWFSLNKLPEMAFDHNQIVREFISEKT